MAFAMPQVSGTLSADPIADLLEIFKSTRGIHAVLAAARGRIDRGSLGPLLHLEQDVMILPPPADVVDTLHTLEERSRLSTETELVREFYSSVINNLRFIFERQSAPTSGRAPMFSWPIMVMSAYLVALARREPMALTILAHYGIMINNTREYWWFATCGRWIVNALSGALIEEWQPSIQWPNEKIAETKLINNEITLLTLGGFVML
ncbi:hypothetical protein MMC27_006308 [Xylographa pallens]|nr:hypothetical protein [Xylographa pallens]